MGVAEGSRTEVPRSAVTIFDMRALGQSEPSQTLNGPIHAGTTDGWVGHVSDCAIRRTCSVMSGALKG